MGNKLVQRFDPNLVFGVRVVFWQELGGKVFHILGGQSIKVDFQLGSSVHMYLQFNSQVSSISYLGDVYPNFIHLLFF